MFLICDLPFMVHCHFPQGWTPVVVLVTFLLRLKHHDKDLVGGFTGASDRFLRVRVHNDIALQQVVDIVVRTGS